MKEKTLFLNNIQILRAIAALLVVFHHDLPHYATMGRPITAISNISEWGFMGVVVLYMIFSLVYYQQIEKPVYLKAIKYKRVS